MPELRFALTFDAEHPDRPRSRPGVADEILDILAGLDARATFFIQGRWAEAYPETARRIADDGHLVGSHGYYHVHLPYLAHEGLIADIDRAETAILLATRVSPRPWFRCPFGAGFDDPRVIAAIEERGYRNIHWDASGEDWQPERTAAEIETGAVAQAFAHGDGAIVLLHAWPEATVEALPGIVRRLRDGGGSLVTLDELTPGAAEPGPAEPGAAEPGGTVIGTLPPG